MKTVYLAGGMRSNWQDITINACPNLKFINPLAHGCKEFREFGTWDLHGVRHCDIVFYYAEKDNPGVGYLMEAAYGKGLGKTVIGVIEPNNHINDRYLAFVKLFSDIVFDDFDKAIEYLGKFEHL